MIARRILHACALGVVFFTAAGCQAKQPADPTATYSDDQKAIYAFGASIGEQVGQQASQLRLTPEELDVFRTGFGDALTGKEPVVKITEYAEHFQKLAQARLEAGAVELKKSGETFLANAAKEEGAVKTDSGLIYRTLKAGDGANPKAEDVVRVHYHGTLVDGKVFDSSVERGQPAQFPLNNVIPCWTEGVQRMKVGEKAKLVCPPAIAYGERGAGASIPGNSVLIFEVELLGIGAEATPAAEAPKEAPK